MKRRVFDLRPTQFAVGMFEVEKKIGKLKRLKEKDVEKYLDEHPVPVVLCRNDEVHLIDHHHLVRACWELGIDKVVTRVEADLSHLDIQDFWKELTRRKWNHLYDQFGNGPHDPTMLPLNVRSLADDIYRGLAWALREAGGYEKTDTLFCEFRWADFLRTRVKVERSENGLKQALKEALKLSESEEAKNLPGFHKR